MGSAADPAHPSDCARPSNGSGRPPPAYNRHQVGEVRTLGSLTESPRARVALLVLGFVLLAATGVVDYVTGWELSLTAVYLGPISLIAWVGGFWAGGAAAFTAALIWALADAGAGHVYTDALIGPWNSLMRLAHFALVGLTLAALKAAWARERKHARHDFLTGIPNSRYFFELAHSRMEHNLREGVSSTLVYLDCDNFKAVNDAVGHAAGDEALKVIAGTIAQEVRATDVVARIGGDEFVMLLAESSRAEAEEVVRRVLAGLERAMTERCWPITFSAGAATFERAPAIDLAIQRAEALMRDAKAGGKGRLVHERVYV